MCLRPLTDHSLLLLTYDAMGEACVHVVVVVVVVVVVGVVVVVVVATGEACKDAYMHVDTCMCMCMRPLTDHLLLLFWYPLLCYCLPRTGVHAVRARHPRPWSAVDP